MARHNHGIHVCSFSTDLCELTQKQQGDPALVLSVIARDGRFSVFDVTDNQIIAGTVEKLIKNGFMGTASVLGYPWIKAIITKEGNQFLKDNGYFPVSGE